MKCEVDGCKKEKYAKGYCHLHYIRFKKYGDPKVNRYANRSTRWTDEYIREEILNSIRILLLNRMPTAEELKTIGRNDLHCKISRTKKYSGWANDLGLELKSCDTRTGQEYEGKAELALIEKGYLVERMTTKYPYDLLVNGTVKIDVKAGSAYYMRGSRVHSFGISKKNPTCDIYICMALDEEGKEIERTFIIPSHYLKVVSLCIGKESTYNRFIDRWDYIEKYKDFYSGIS